MSNEEIKSEIVKVLQMGSWCYFHDFIDHLPTVEVHRVEDALMELIDCDRVMQNDEQYLLMY